MPGTTRYSATFDRPYEEEEDDLPANPPVVRRSRSHSLQATTIGNGRPYTPLGGAYRPHARSSSTDNGAPKGAEVIPTRTVGKAAVKAHSNPFQFVKVGTCPLYKKAEEQLKTVKEDKKPEVVKEEEEEWQTNLDSWKSRRRKMSESAFRRQEEMKQIEMEEKTFCTQQKKIKTFSEMVEERAHRGRTLSLCLFSNPLDLDEWKYDKNKNTEDDDTNSNDNQPLSGESEESSVIHSEDDSNDTYLKHEQSHVDRNGNKSIQNGVKMRRTGAPNVLHKQNGFHKDALKTNSDFKLAELDISQESITQKEEHGLSGVYIDSGLESLSSSHRAGDIPDSGSDFSQDSGSSMDCDSPRVTRLITTGVELLEEFSSKDDDLSNGDVFHNEKSSGMEFSLRLCLTGNSSHHYGFTISGGKDKGSSITVASVIKGSVSDSAGLKTDDQILAVNNEDISSLTHSAVVSLLKKAVDTRQINLLLRRSLPADNTKKLSSSVPIAATRNKTSAKSDNSNKLDSEVLKNKLAANSSEKNAESKDDISKKQAPKILNAFGKDVNARNKQTEIDASSEHKERSVESENEMYVDDFDELELMEKNNVGVSMAQENAASPGVDSNASNVTNKSDPIVGHNNKAPISSAAVKDSSLNIIYQSHSSGSLPTTQNTSKKSSESKICNGDNIQTPKVYSNATTPVNEVPVEKVAEEMERLILEQLEQEERAKEMASEIELNGNFETENQIHKQMDMEAPPRQLEPPKEKPPPPPCSTNSSQKPCSLKRVNSTKRIKKEIHKRRSDFLGIDTDEENAMCDESSVPLPPALEDILKAEREGDRVRRQMLVDASLQKSVEDEEIARKELEIIANLETEERRKLNIDGNFPDTSNSNEAQIEEERINRLKEERKLIEEERLMKEEQKIRLDEERLLREREDYVRKQEGIKLAGSCSSISVTTPDNTNTDGNIKTLSEQSKVEINANSDVSCDQLCDLKDITCDISQKDDSSVKPTPVLSLPATSTINIAKPTPDSSFSSSATNNMLVQNGDGQNTNMSISVAPSNDKISKTEETVPPPVPKKPVKKKEVIRKERERLRHEQEVLMREREEYRRKVQLEQEQLKKNSQKPHVSDVPMSRVGPPPPAKPALPSQLTPPTHVPQALREDMYASRSLQCSGRNNIAENHAVASQQQSQRQAASRQNRIAQPRTKPALNEAWTQHKVPVVRKQTDSSAESRYNQNHWLIQEAEMRRITEQKERQRGQIPTDTRYQPTTQIPFHQTPHIEESSGSHMAVQRPTVMPAAQPLTVKPSNYSMITPMHASEQQWNYGQPVHPNAQNKKYPSPPVVNMGSDISQPVTAYSRNFTDPNLQPPTKPSRIVPVEKQEQMLSVSGRKRCSHCGEELGRGAAMIIESLQLYYHIHCFRCCVCQAQLGNGSCGTDVRVRNNKLHCHNCYSNDEAGLKFSQV